MKVAKLKKIKEQKPKKKEVEEFSIKNFIITILIIVAVLGVFYFITVLVVKPIIEPKNTTPAKLDPTKITMSQIKTRKEDSYYVLATKESEYMNLYTDMNYGKLYENAISKLTDVTFYRVDMDDALNSAYWGEEFDLDTLTINDEVLFKIENGKIDEYYIGHSDILDALENL